MVEKRYPKFPNGKTKWDELTKEEKKAFTAESLELHHEYQYLVALEYSGTSGPAWEDLTEDQRENIRQENSRYFQEMHEFGKSIAKKGGF